MKEIILQITPRGIMPHSEEDWDVLRGEYGTNELIRCKSYHVSKVKVASIEQGNLLHACFKLLAESKGLPNMQTGQQVKFACKVGIHFIDQNKIGVRPDGVVVFEYRSFAHDKLFGKERLIVVDQAFDWLADKAGVTVDVLVDMAKEKMQKRI